MPTPTFTALLFDMDGTLIDSTAAITAHWHALGREIGIPGDRILQTSHGRRSLDVLGILAPHLATWDYVCAAEARIPQEHGDSAREIPGARALLDALDQGGVKWGIVTSGTRGLVEGWLGVMGLVRPGVLVTAEDVAKGKPDPAGYLRGAGELGVEGGGEGVLVLEDAPAGVRAGKAAGCRVLGVATTHAVAELRAAGADWVVRDLRSVGFVGVDGETGEVRIEVRDVLVD